ncbi:MAG: TIGR00341 family protein [Candidatus Neomarinimicrobiota bacterium]
MPLQIIKIITEPRFNEKLDELAKKPDVIESWKNIDKKNDRLYMNIIIVSQNIQKMLDKAESICGRTSDSHILVLPVTAAISPEIKKIAQKRTKIISREAPVTREELYHKIILGTKLDIDFILLIFLSTVVAAIGLLENNITVLIGAMVIAPLLGPNLAMALAMTLGDRRLMIRALHINLAGITICVILGFLIGFIWPHDVASTQIMLRTRVSYDSLVLALASGAAAVLSTVSGLSSILVGVMVAAALLPSITVCGIMLGAGLFDHAAGAGLLFAVNIACINLSANLTFIWKGICPGRWYEKRKAKKAVRHNLIFWTILLLVLAMLIYIRHGLVFKSVM